MSSLHINLYKAHGFFAFVAWGILAPLAVAAPLLRGSFVMTNKWWCCSSSSSLPSSLWFRIHLSLNLTVFIFTAMAFAFATRAIELQATANDHFHNVRHQKTGLLIMIMVFGQTLSGLVFRPPLHVFTVAQANHDTEEEPDAVDNPTSSSSQQTTPPNNNNKSRIRIVWERCHRYHGLILIFFAWWQVQDGLRLYSIYFAAKDFRSWFWGITGSISIIIAILFVLKLVGI